MNPGGAAERVEHGFSGHALNADRDAWDWRGKKARTFRIAIALSLAIYSSARPAVTAESVTLQRHNLGRYSNSVLGAGWAALWLRC